MIIGILNPGSGIGDMLFSYIATRVRAADLGVDFGFIGKDYFKGKSFMNLDFGKPVQALFEIEQSSGKINVLTIDAKSVDKIYELNKPYYDPNFNFIPDGSVIDGYGAQDIRYFEHRLNEVREWLKIDLGQIAEMNWRPGHCVINYRGGEYKYVPELYLTKDYWDKAISKMRESGVTRFFVTTDDVEEAKKMFPDFQITHDLANDWYAIYSCPNVILSNSAFGVIPAILNEDATVICPKFWAGRNVGEWRRPGNYYKKFTYI